MSAVERHCLLAELTKLFNKIKSISNDDNINVMFQSREKVVGSIFYLINTGGKWTCALIFFNTGFGRRGRKEDCNKHKCTQAGNCGPDKQDNVTAGGMAVRLSNPQQGKSRWRKQLLMLNIRDKPFPCNHRPSATFHACNQTVLREKRRQKWCVKCCGFPFCLSLMLQSKNVNCAWLAKINSPKTCYRELFLY